MGKWIKSYTTFVPLWYRIVILGIVPVGMIVVYSVLPSNEDVRGIASYVLAMWFIIAELFGDFGAFCGIVAKHSLQLEYVRSSYDGMNYVKRAVVVDVLRRFLWMMVMFSVWGMPLGGVYCFVAFTLVQNITRYFDSWSTYLIGVTFASMLVFGILNAILGVTEIVSHTWWLWLLGIVLAVATSGLLVWHIMKRVTNSYYDDKKENGYD